MREEVRAWKRVESKEHTNSIYTDTLYKINSANKERNTFTKIFKLLIHDAMVEYYGIYQNARIYNAIYKICYVIL